MRFRLRILLPWINSFLAMALAVWMVAHAYLIGKPSAWVFFGIFAIIFVVKSVEPLRNARKIS